jgi:hypothetical protein
VKLRYVGDKTRYEVHEGFAVCDGKKTRFDDDSKFGVSEDGTIFYVSSREHRLSPGTIVGRVGEGVLHTATVHGAAVDDVTIARKGDILIYRQWNAAARGDPGYVFTAILTRNPSLLHGSPNP